LAVEHDFHIGEIEDIREPVGLAARGKMLEPLSLAHVAQRWPTSATCIPL